MTCASCQAKIEELLQSIDGVTAVSVDLPNGRADVTMSRHIDTEVLAAALRPYPQYRISDAVPEPHPSPEPQKTWWQTYKPVLLIFAYVTTAAVVVQAGVGAFDAMAAMNDFMGGFFLAFSFFKLLNLSGFADSYATYDIIARRWRGYGYLYAFLELALGLAYLTDFRPLLTNAVTFVVMGISLIGVLQSVLDRRKIRCACLGDVFALPMSTVTVIEDALMVVMAGIMLITLI